MRVAAVVPAYNEAQRIGSVLEVLDRTQAVNEVIVVDDASTDGTAEAVPQNDGIRTIVLPDNRGKGGAMHAGARSTQADVIVFLDADLVGLTPAHVDSLVAPVLADEADMAVGIFQGGRCVTDLSQWLVPYISGQRAVRRDTFLAVTGLQTARFAVETRLTKYAKANHLRIQHVPLQGVTHVLKEEKRGVLRGFWDRLRMYREIVPTLLQNGRPLGPSCPSGSGRTSGPRSRSMGRSDRSRARTSGDDGPGGLPR